MLKTILRISLSLAILCLTTMAQASYIEWDSAVNPANGHSYYIYYSPVNPVNTSLAHLHVDNTNAITWTQANAEAISLGGYLATITSEAEEIFLQTVFAGSVKLEGIRAWIGLSDRDEEGVFKWITGPESGQKLSYADWMNGEPNNTGNEDYVEWRNYPWGPSGGAWNDVPPDAWGVNTFMVEVDPVPEPATMLLFGLGLLGLAGVSRKK